MAAKKWINAMNAGKGPKKGALHEEMGVPKGDKIPKKKLEEAAKKPGIEGKRARLAETLEGFHKGGKAKDEKESPKTKKLETKKDELKKKADDKGKKPKTKK